MITNERYFSLLKHEIERGSLPRLKVAMECIRADYVKGKVEQGLLDPKLVRMKSMGLMVSQGLVDVRGKGDLTPIMWACIVYRQKSLDADHLGAQAADAIADWLLQEQASVGAQGGREIIRSTDRRTGEAIHERGRGKTIMEALGWANLPPSVQRHIKRRRLVVEPELAAA